MSTDAELDYRCNSAPPTGDKGQRYEVTAYDLEDKARRVIGWTNEPDGGGLAEGARLWPRVNDVQVIDRESRPRRPFWAPR